MIMIPKEFNILFVHADLYNNILDELDHNSMGLLCFQLPVQENKFSQNGQGLEVSTTDANLEVFEAFIENFNGLLDSGCGHRFMRADGDVCRRQSFLYCFNGLF